jgi:transcriptional regulator with XRE-family HTH domain
MRIAALTRFKHGAMLEAMRAVGWSQRKLAQEVGIHQTAMGDYINLKRKPNAKMLDRIQAAFGRAGHYVDVTEWFPEKFVGFKQRIEVVEVREIDHLQLESNTDERMIYLEDSMSCLTDRERKVVELRQEGLMFKQIGSKISPRFPVSRARVQQIHCKAMRKLRERITKVSSLDNYGLSIDENDNFKFSGDANGSIEADAYAKTILKTGDYGKAKLAREDGKFRDGMLKEFFA